MPVEDRRGEMPYEGGEHKGLLRNAQKKFASYIGEIAPAVNNSAQRNFHASRPNTLWLTNISELAAPGSKIYLRPMMIALMAKLLPGRHQNILTTN